MLILAIRTDKLEAELALFEDQRQLAEKIWQAHRELAETIHVEIANLLEANGKKLRGLQGIACFAGPGSFTGLRIGLTVANALAYGLEIPVVSASGEDWQQTAIAQLLEGQNARIVTPDYGAPVHITAPKR